MQEKITDIALLVLGLVILSCQATMMYVFIGGSGGSDAQALLTAQAWVAPAALLVFLALLLRDVARDGWRGCVRGLWRPLPAWIVLALVVLNLLVFIGELSLFLRARLMAHQALWFEHAPLLCVLGCSLAFVALYGRSSLANDAAHATVGRW
jgi:hypothetical protein